MSFNNLSETDRKKILNRVKRLKAMADDSSSENEAMIAACTGARGPLSARGGASAETPRHVRGTTSQNTGLAQGKAGRTGIYQPSTHTRQFQAMTTSSAFKAGYAWAREEIEMRGKPRHKVEAQADCAFDFTDFDRGAQAYLSDTDTSDDIEKVIYG